MQGILKPWYLTLLLFQCMYNYTPHYTHFGMPTKNEKWKRQCMLLTTLKVLVTTATTLLPNFAGLVAVSYKVDNGTLKKIASEMMKGKL